MKIPGSVLLFASKVEPNHTTVLRLIFQANRIGKFTNTELACKMTSMGGEEGARFVTELHVYIRYNGTYFVVIVVCGLDRSKANVYQMLDINFRFLVSI